MKKNECWSIKDTKKSYIIISHDGLKIATLEGSDENWERAKLVCLAPMMFRLLKEFTEKVDNLTLRELSNFSGEAIQLIEKIKKAKR